MLMMNKPLMLKDFEIFSWLLRHWNIQMMFRKVNLGPSTKHNFPYKITSNVIRVLMLLRFCKRIISSCSFSYCGFTYICCVYSEKISEMFILYLYIQKQKHIDIFCRNCLGDCPTIQTSKRKMPRVFILMNEKQICLRLLNSIWKKLKYIQLYHTVQRDQFHLLMWTLCSATFIGVRNAITLL